MGKKISQKVTKNAKKCQKEPKFGLTRRHVAKPAEAGRSVVTIILKYIPIIYAYRHVRNENKSLTCLDYPRKVSTTDTHKH